MFLSEIMFPRTISQNGRNQQQRNTFANMANSWSITNNVIYCLHNSLNIEPFSAPLQYQVNTFSKRWALSLCPWMGQWTCPEIPKICRKNVGFPHNGINLLFRHHLSLNIHTTTAMVVLLPRCPIAHCNQVTYTAPVTKYHRLDTDKTFTGAKSRYWESEF